MVAKCCCPSKCCKPSPGNRQCWGFLLFVGAVVLVAGSYLVREEVLDLKDNIKCTTFQLRRLNQEATTNSVSQTTGFGTPTQAGQAVDMNAVDRAEQIADILEYLAAGPGAAACAMCLMTLFFAVLATNCACRSGTCFSKLSNVIAWLLNFVAIVVFGICIVVGVLAGPSGPIKSKWDENVVTACTTYQADMNTMLTFANGRSNQAEINFATNTLTSFDAMCTCLKVTVSLLEKLRDPGAVGLVGALLVFLSLPSFCCTVNCCSSLPVTKDDKMAPAQKV